LTGKSDFRIASGENFGASVFCRCVRAVGRRLPLLDRDVNELKEKLIQLSQSLKLTQIQDGPKQEIIEADSKSGDRRFFFRTYVQIRKYL